MLKKRGRKEMPAVALAAFSVRFTAEELRTVRSAAHFKGFASVAAYLKAIALGKVTVTAALK